MKRYLLTLTLVTLLFPTLSSAAIITFSPASGSTFATNSPIVVTAKLNTQNAAVDGFQVIASYTYTTQPAFLSSSSVSNIHPTFSNCFTNSITTDTTAKKVTLTAICTIPLTGGLPLNTGTSETNLFTFTLTPQAAGSINFDFTSSPNKISQYQTGTNLLSSSPSLTYSYAPSLPSFTPTPTIRSYGTCQGTDTSTCNFPVCPGGCDICRGTPACQNNLCVLAPVTNGTACFVPVSLLEGNCFNGTCQAPATPAPSKTPVPPTPTSVPPTQIPTPTLVIPSPTPISVSTPIDLEISLQGSANLNSIQPRVSVTIKQNNQLVYSNPVVPFTSYYQLTGSSTYRGSVYIPNEDFSTGPAEIIIKGPAHLAKKFTVNLIKSQTNSFDLSGAATLKAGDLWGPAGQPDNTIQLGDITAFVSQWTQVSQPVTPSNYLYDLNFDGTINVSDMSLILSNWGTSSPIIFGDN